MATLATTVNVDINATLQDALDMSVTTKVPLAKQIRDTLASGTGLDQADLVWFETRTLATGANEDLDLAGVLTSALGATLTFARVKMIFIENTNLSRALTIGNSGVNSFINWVGAAAHTITVRPGGFVLFYAPDATGYAVTAATGDILKITNAAGGDTIYNIVIIGASA